MGYGTGSTGYTSASRVKLVIDEFFARPLESQTSAVFASIWSSRASIPDVSLPYLIGGGEPNNSSGWWSYVKRLHGSTYNTSTRSAGGVLGLPSPAWTQFVADRATLAALSTHVSGTTDSDHGRRVYEFLVSTSINSKKYHSGVYRELLEAWAARGSSDIGSS